MNLGDLPLVKAAPVLGDQTYLDALGMGCPTSSTNVGSGISQHQQLVELIAAVSQAHYASCAYTDDKLRNLVRKPVVIVVRIVDNVTIKTWTLR